MMMSGVVVLMIWLFSSSLVAAVVVEYDHRALVIDGKRRVLLSGSIHYPRSTPEMWEDLIQKSKDGGLDVIETYVFWNAHEPVRNHYDFQGRNDLVKFVKLVAQAGLFLHLRIGPYVCAEWNYGGFPLWLHFIPGIKFRTDNEPFKREMQRFTTKIVNLMKQEKLYASQGGPIILSQIENEYGNIQSSYGSAAKPYVNWSASMATSLDTGVPWVMCQQSDAPDPIINTCNGFYCDQFTPNSDNKPKMWTENWTGWFLSFGGAVPYRPVEDIAFSVARFFQRGGTFQNYYMYHGGTNFGRTTGGPFISTSYDYDAPIDEYGLVRQPKWGHLKDLHKAIKLCEEALIATDPAFTSLGTNLEAHVYKTASGVCSAFLANVGTQSDANVNFNGNSYHLPAWSVSILPDCKNVVFNTAKIAGACQIKDFRPISLINSAYKVVSKVLTNRLKTVIGSLISPCQSAFIHDRQITDSVLIAAELIHSRQSSRQAGLIFKVDFEKAYDCVRWDFLEVTMKEMGFATKWINWIMRSISNVHYSILLFGKDEGFVKAGKGLRQGDPLSPFLFTLVAEVLARLMSRANMDNRIRGFEVRPGGPKVNLLQYADDSLFFCDDDPSQISNLRDVLLRFSKASGLEINFSKSMIFAVGQCEHLHQCAEILGCSVSGWPMKYLGFQLGSTSRCQLMWKGVLDSVQQKLSVWKSKLLSKAGRVALVRGALSDLPIYTMALFPIPGKTSKELQRIISRFIWRHGDDQRGLHLCRWEKLCQPKLNGGLGLKDFRCMNKALMCKWGWRFIQEPESLWRIVIAAKYGFSEGDWLPKTPRGSIGCSVWHGIAKSLPLFFRFIRFKAESGSKIKFWTDQWTGERSLALSFPLLYRVSLRRDGMIADFVSQGQGWNLWLRRALNDEESLEADVCLSNLPPPILTDRPDRVIWNPNKKGVFSVRSCYQILFSDGTGGGSDREFPWKWFWKAKAAPKMKMVAWCAVKEILPTRDFLLRRNMMVTPNCVCCAEGEEDSNHVLLNGHFAWDIWQHFLGRVGFIWTMPLSLRNLFQCWKAVKWKSAVAKFLWHTLPFVIIWVLWSERNARIFQSKWKRKTQLVNDILGIWWWWGSIKKLPLPRLDHFMFSWHLVLE